MHPELPQIIEPTRLARAGEAITGQYAIEDMPRLVERLHDKQGAVDFRLEFFRDETSEKDFVKGNVVSSVNVQCQRCLEPMAYLIDSDVFLGVMSESDELSALPEDCEPLYEDRGEILLKDLIEDELLLSLPFTVMHNKAECDASDLIETINVSDKQNPFAVLESLKKQRTK